MFVTRRSALVLAASVPLPWLVPARAEARAPSICAPEGLALGGRDPVSYFADGKPEPGTRDYALKWRGALWLFTSIASMERFEMTPHAFAPRYGGYCAMSMAQGVLANGDPEIWEIHDGRLYLLSSRADRKEWDGDVDGHIAAADRHWPALLAQG